MRYFTLIFMLFFLNACSQSPAKQEKQISIKQEQEKPVKKEILVAIQPLEGPGNELCEIVKNQIVLFYGFKVDVLPETLLPECAYYAARNRYRADTLLDYLIRTKPEKYNYIIGIIEKDISCTSEPYDDWGVFGLGFMPGKSCVISTFRLKKNMKSEEQFRERVIKVVLHELGHNLGLDHCPTKACMMQDAEGTIKSVDGEKIEVCDKCKFKLKKLVN